MQHEVFTLLQYLSSLPIFCGFSVQCFACGLGAYVTYVEKKGPADSYDIVEGVFEIMQKIQQYDLSCYSDIV
jgi:hypothetical protein